MRRLATTKPHGTNIQCDSTRTGLGMRLLQRSRDNYSIYPLSRSPSTSIVIEECVLSSQSLQLVAAGFIRVSVWGGGHEHGCYNYCLCAWPFSIERPYFALKKTTTCPQFWILRISMTSITVDYMLWRLVRISRWGGRLDRKCRTILHTVTSSRNSTDNSVSRRLWRLS